MTTTFAAIGPAPVRFLAAEAAPRRLGAALTTVVIVYGTCLLLALAYPQAVVDWLEDCEPNPVVRSAQLCADWVSSGSHRLGLAQISERVRAAGKHLTHKPE